MKSKAKSVPTQTPSKSTAKSVPRAPKRQKRCNKRAKLSPPAIIVPNSPEFRALQRAWYNKAAASGFNDLEKFIGQDMQPADLLHGPSLRNAANMYSNAKLHYYRQWSCYLAHNADVLTPRDKLICEQYATGATYEDISKQLKAARPRMLNTSKSQIHYTIKRIRNYVVQFNNADPRGLDFSADIEP